MNYRNSGRISSGFGLSAQRSTEEYGDVYRQRGRGNWIHGALDKIGGNHILRRVLSRTPKIMMYHGVIDDGEDIDCWWLTRESEFVRQIRYIKRHFKVISIDEFYGCATGSKGFPKNTCVLTFDDGYRTYLTKVLPLLKEEELPSTVYITVGPSSTQGLIWTDKVFWAIQKTKAETLDLRSSGLGIWNMDSKRQKIGAGHELVDLLKKVPPRERNAVVEQIIERLRRPGCSAGCGEKNPFRLLSIQDIRRLSKESLVTIGCHSATHEILPLLDPEAAEREVVSCKRVLEAWIGKPVEHFSWPDGKFNSRLEELLRKAGYKTATRIGLGLFRKDRLFQIPRLATGCWDDQYTFRAMINGYFSVKIELLAGVSRCVNSRKRLTSERSAGFAE